MKTELDDLAEKIYAALVVHGTTDDGTEEASFKIGVAEFAYEWAGLS